MRDWSKPQFIEVEVKRDTRGYFFEAFQDDALSGFVQDNCSVSYQRVLRGLHAQTDTGKLVRCLNGRIFDVAVDLATGEFTTVHLNRPWQAFWIPKGHAHGFLTLTPEATIYYKVTRLYAPGDERVIRWNDPDLKIPWPIDGYEPILSHRDKNGGRFRA